MRYTYSRWSGAESVSADADLVMEALADDLMADGDLQGALQRINRWGLQVGEHPLPGVQALQQQIRAARQELTQRYDIDSVLTNLEERLQDIVKEEREAIERRRSEGDGDESAAAALRLVADKKVQSLAVLPDEPAAIMSALADYEFLDEGARQAFEELSGELQRHVLDTALSDMKSSLQSLSPDDIGRLGAMLHDLAHLLEGAGDPADFETFMSLHGRYFPEAGSLPVLANQLRSSASRLDQLLRSMSPHSRRELERVIEAALGDLAEDASRVASALRLPKERPRSDHFCGQDSIAFDEALELMRRLHELDALEAAAGRAQDSGNLDSLDERELAGTLGQEASDAVATLKRIGEILERAGFVERRGAELELTPRGVRRIGQKALDDVFAHLKRDAFGDHIVDGSSPSPDSSGATRRYQFGDPFLPDIERTLMNAAVRGGAPPLDLEVADFEVVLTDSLTQASTVLLLDMSRSMPLRGCFVAAKKVALALSSLIRIRYPRDRLYVVGFSDYARLLEPEALHRISWGDYVYGTNMQHGFSLARRLLGRHRAGTRQIILITDGEPTAHFDGEQIQFSYPPTFQTFQETLREVRRCTREGILINTFMLERSHYLTDFVNRMTDINRGRAFFTTPERLGDYILVDYVSSRRRSA
ncbi:MAG: vWA domain-containing protein [Chloroflexota bacterium]